MSLFSEKLVMAKFYIVLLQYLHFHRAILITFFSFLGDITQKGYDKKRTKLLAPYMRKTKIEQITLNSSANTSSISVASSSLMSTAAPASEVAASSTSSPPNGNGNNRIDLKTPSFIPVESSTSSELMAAGFEAAATNNEDIEPDSLDPNINNGDDLVIVGAPSKEEQPPPLPSHSELKFKTNKKMLFS